MSYDFKPAVPGWYIKTEGPETTYSRVLGWKTDKGSGYVVVTPMIVTPTGITDAHLGERITSDIGAHTNTLVYLPDRYRDEDAPAPDPTPNFGTAFRWRGASDSHEDGNWRCECGSYTLHSHVICWACGRQRKNCEEPSPADNVTHLKTKTEPESAPVPDFQSFMDAVGRIQALSKAVSEILNQPRPGGKTDA